MRGTARAHICTPVLTSKLCLKTPCHTNVPRQLLIRKRDLYLHQWKGHPIKKFKNCLVAPKMMYLIVDFLCHVKCRSSSSVTLPAVCMSCRDQQMHSPCSSSSHSSSCSTPNTDASVRKCGDGSSSRWSDHSSSQGGMSRSYSTDHIAVIDFYSLDR